MTQKQETNRSLKIRKPQLKDGNSIYNLIRRSYPLDINSLYTYLLLCSHFDHTSAVVEVKEDLVGYTSAYIHPHKDDTLFIWQIAVKENMRDQGIAKMMIMDILRRKELAGIKFIEATLTLSNKASEALFSRLAGHLQAECRQFPYFTKDLFKESSHEEEFLLRIGPFKN